MTEPTPEETRRLLTLTALVGWMCACQYARVAWHWPEWSTWTGMVLGAMGLVYFGMDARKR